MLTNIQRKTFDMIYRGLGLSAQKLRNKTNVCFSANTIPTCTLQNYVSVSHSQNYNTLTCLTKRNNVFTGKEEWCVFHKKNFVAIKYH